MAGAKRKAAAVAAIVAKDSKGKTSKPEKIEKIATPAAAAAKRKGKAGGGAYARMREMAGDVDEDEDSEEEDDEEEEEAADEATRQRLATVATAAAGGAGNSGRFVNREKVLVLSSRGITYRYRHLMDDLHTILPHAKKEVKLDEKHDRAVLNEVTELKGCSSTIFFEVRKRRDLYLWLAKTPMGPSCKFLAANCHTMNELKMTGNHMKGSRPLLSFDKNFETLPHLELIKEMLAQLFGTPKNCRRGKPFVDHVLTFTWLDGRVWCRNYSIVDEKGNPAGARADKTALDGLNLVEVGPRFCLMPIRIFEGAFRGSVLYKNEAYLSPAQLRAMERNEKSKDFGKKVKRKNKRTEHEARYAPQPGEFDGLFKGGGGDMSEEEFSD